MVEIAGVRTLGDLKGALENLSRSDFLTEINSSTFLMRLRASLLPQAGQVGYEEAVESIGRWLEENPIDLEKAINPAAVAHLAVFRPDDLWSRKLLCRDYFPQFEYNESCAMFSNKQSLENIHDILTTDSSVKLSPTMALVAAFAAAAYHYPKEAELLGALENRMTDHGNASRLAKAALLMRSRGLARRAARGSREVVAGRIAVLVSGQLRAPEVSLPQLAHAVALENADVYVSTWSKVGGTPIERSRLTRRLDASAVAWAREKLSDTELEAISKADENGRKSSENRLREQIAVSLGIVNDLRINIDDDSHVLFRAMNNHEKMHYHNSFWLRELGHDHFRKHYDSLVKIRPDSLIAPEARIDSQTTLSGNGDLFVDHPDWLFHPWGFGMGDQVFYGPTESMIPVLDIENGRSLSTRLLSEVFGGMSAYRGHINVGIELWLQGGQPNAPHFKKRGLASPKLLSIDDIRTMVDLKEGSN